jgi:hypothetical protein
MSRDKYLCRLAASGVPAVLMYGLWWALEKGGIYAVEFNRKAPGQSKVVRVRAPAA